MSKKVTTDSFIKEAKILHGNKYDYSLVNYVSAREPVIIICPIHGEFLQSQNVHLRPSGCRKCGNIDTGKNLKYTIEEVISKANVVHNNKYNYDNISYVNNTTPLTIRCKIHGVFYQKTASHLSGHGCPSCSKDRRVMSRTSTRDEFISKSKLSHSIVYNYDKVIYNTARSNVIIGCPIHGEFKQIAHAHLKGANCPACSIDENRSNPLGYGLQNWINSASNSKRFESFKIYTIKCHNENESFIKIGRTYTSINNRFVKHFMPYNFEVLDVVTGSGSEIFKMEIEIKSKLREFRYVPLIKFSGMYECFNMDVLKELNLTSVGK